MNQPWAGEVIEVLPNGYIKVQWIDKSFETVYYDQLLIIEDENEYDEDDEDDDDFDDSNGWETEEEVDDISPKSVTSNRFSDNTRQSSNRPSRDKVEAPTPGTSIPTEGVTVTPSRQFDFEAIDSRKIPSFEILDEDVPLDHAYLSMNANHGSKDWIKKLRKEHALLAEGLPDTIYCCTFETRLDLFRFIIHGPVGTP
jgi:hypothetical protein